MVHNEHISPTFPEFRIEIKGRVPHDAEPTRWLIAIFTTMRLKFNDTFYLQNFVEKHYYDKNPNENPELIIEAIKRFNRNAYLHQKLGKYSDVKDMFGMPVMMPDIMQKPEEDRIIEKYLPHHITIKNKENGH